MALPSCIAGYCSRCAGCASYLELEFAQRWLWQLCAISIVPNALQAMAIAKASKSPDSASVLLPLANRWPTKSRQFTHKWILARDNVWRAAPDLVAYRCARNWSSL